MAAIREPHQAVAADPREILFRGNSTYYLKNTYSSIVPNFLLRVSERNGRVHLGVKIWPLSETPPPNGRQWHGYLSAIE